MTIDRETSVRRAPSAASARLRAASFASVVRRLAPCALGAACVLCALAGPAPAQTGPWQDGEIVLLNPDGGAWKLLRIDPSTGDGELLATPKYWGGWAGGMVFDPYRDGVIACMSLEPDPYSKYEPYVVSSDGTTTALPGLDFVGLKAMAAVGDGRVYFQRRTPPSSQIEYYDAGNTLHVLMDATGSTPLLLDIEHALYDAAGDALIATQSVHWSGPGCSPTENTIWRIPLSSDGSQVAGPITCTTFASASENVMSLDRYPGGLMFTVLAGSAEPQKLWVVDPSGPSVFPWGTMDLVDLNGGMYSQRLGKAIVFEDFSNELRVFGPGVGHDGVTLPVDVPIGDSTTGSSPADWLFDIDALGPACDGFHVTYGTGLSGKGGFVPTLAATGCPDVGSTFGVVVDDVVGGASGILFIGLGATSVPFKGGSFLVDAVALQVPLGVGGTPGQPGAGDLGFPILLGDPLFVGLDLYWQVGFVDAGAVLGVSLSNGLRVQAG
ncbi:MAG: hypothetical protein H6697_11740 [Myxococcales bacterium]|nr:hypothetical protein [Myxococcales bacterium]